MSSLPPDLKSRFMATLPKHPAPPRSAARPALAWLLGSLSAVALFAMSGFRQGTRPLAFLAVSAAGWAVLGALALAFSYVRGGSMLGRDRRTLELVLAGGPAVLLWMVICLAIWPEAGEASAPRLAHVACFVYSLLIAAGPFAAMAYLRRGSDPVKPRLTLSAYGAAAGLLAGALMDVHCAYANFEHVVCGHVLPVVGFAALGWLLGRRILGVSPSR